MMMMMVVTAARSQLGPAAAALAVPECLAPHMARRKWFRGLPLLLSGDCPAV